MPLKLSTKRKLRIARAASALIKGIRSAFGLDPRRTLSRRGGINWKLDLSEGIDLSIYLFGCFEPSTAEALSRHVRPGMTVLDIGANIGAHALPLARLVGPEGKVFAVEPTDWAFKRMLENLALNPALARTLIPVQAALLAPGSLQPAGFYSSWSLEEKTGAHPVHGGTRLAAAQAEVMTLDDLVQRSCPDRIDLIKLDVDGHEVQVLRGAQETLERFRPELFFELCPYALQETGASAEELLFILKFHGYTLYHEDGRPFPADAASLRRVPAGGSLNLHARAAQGLIAPGRWEAQLTRAYLVFSALVLALYLMSVWDYAHSRSRLANIILRGRGVIARKLGARPFIAGLEKDCDALSR